MADQLESDPEDISLEESLLVCARRGQATIIKDILKSRKEGKIDVDINCKGTQKSNRGWTPLHLASYFGHKDVVQVLLENGACVNEPNNQGDRSLHKAALTGRVEVVMLLIQHGADVSVVNAEGFTPKSVSNNQDIIKLIEAAEQHEVCRLEEEFMSSVRLGQVDKIEDLVSRGNVIHMNCQDSFGNSPLHVAARAGQKEVAVLLLQKGVDTAMKNKQGLLAAEVAKTEQMKQLLKDVTPKKEATKVPSRFEGLLIKRAFVGRRQPVWVVLERGVMSYFRNRGDASTGSKRKSMKYLDEAKVKIYEENSYDFMVTFSDGTAHKLGIDPGASEVKLGRDPATGEIVSRQMWLNSLKEHIAYNTHYIHQGELPPHEVPVASMQEAFKLAQAHQDVLEHQVNQLSTYLSQSQENTRSGNLGKLESELRKTVKYSKDMCSSLSMCLSQFSQQEELREKMLHEEREQNRVLQEALHALAIEHHQLERSYSHSYRSRSNSVDDDEFFDCDEDEDLGFRRPQSPTARSVHSLVSDAFSFKSCQFDVDGEFGSHTERKDNSGDTPKLNFQVQLSGRFF